MSCFYSGCTYLKLPGAGLATSFWLTANMNKAYGGVARDQFRNWK